MAIDYNRFLYVRGNPFKYLDLSGHIALCFMGGINPDPDPDKFNEGAGFPGACTAALDAMGYVEKEHGEIRFNKNNANRVEEINEELLSLKAGENPSSEPNYRLML